MKIYIYTYIYIYIRISYQDYNIMTIPVIPENKLRYFSCNVEEYNSNNIPLIAILEIKINVSHLANYPGED